MMSGPRVSIPLLLVLATFAWATRATPQDAPPGDDRALATARDLLRQAARALDEQIQENPRRGVHHATTLAELAGLLAEVGDHEAAEATLRRLGRAGAVSASALRAVATGYARAGDMRRVRETIGRIQDAGSKEYNPRAWAWYDSGRALARLGHEEWAVEAFAEAAREVTEAKGLTPEILMAIAEGQHEIGRDDESAATLDRAASLVLSDPEQSWYYVSQVVDAQARLGFLPRALAVVERFADPNGGRHLYRVIVEASSAAGRLDDAYRVAERIDGNAVTETWIAIAAAEAKAGRPAEARRALDRAEAGDEPGGDKMLIQKSIMLAQARATIGDRRGAEERLTRAVAIARRSVGAEMRSPAFLGEKEQVPGSVDRRVNFLWIGDAQAKLGFKDAARASYEEARLALPGEPPGIWRVAAVTSMAASQADAGMPDEAMKTLAGLPRSELTWHAYMPIAKAMARAGDVDGALRVADMYPGDAFTARGYVARTLLEAGDPAGALKLSLRSEAWGETLHDAARQLAASGDVARVIEAAPRVAPEDRVSLLVGAADGLLERVRARPNPR